MISLALSKFNINTHWSVPNEDSYSEIVWGDSSDPSIPSEAEVLAKVSEIQQERIDTQYQRERQYPTIAEQLDMQYWDSVNGTTTWADAIAAVKTANPKPE